MKVFATLVQALDSTNKVNQKLDAIIQFLQDADEMDKLWLLALFTGKRPKRSINSDLMRLWAMEVADVPEWLFAECYAAVGDLGETIALILPPANMYVERSLNEWMQLIVGLKSKSEEEKKEFVLHAWKTLPLTERFIFNKLLGGSFRLGMSSKTLINALAKHFKLDANAVTHSIMGDWKVDNISFQDLIYGNYTNTQLSKPYPFCLAYALDKDPDDLGNIADWQAEYKWDGIRAQLIKRNDEVFIWSRGEEIITEQFPEVKLMLQHLPYNFVLDGEMLIFKDGRVQNFSELQKRLNRKSITKKMLLELPATVFVYDLLEWEGEDIRSKSLQTRRKLLEDIFEQYPVSGMHLSPCIQVSGWNELKLLRENARSNNSEGLMLKHKESIYHTGRKKGDWWKWKMDPLTIDAVLIYAQKGSGRRSAYYTDYTFAVKSGEGLVTIAKAYSGLTDIEIQEVSRFVNKNAIEKFGPLRTVQPELVFEIAFEGIAYSNRHKSGVALRFPRIVRWRKDKTVDEIDDIEQVKLLITSS